MLISDQEARQRECLLMWRPRITAIPGMGQAPWTGISETTCYGSSCVAYWRWFNPEKTQGYCSLGGKPDF
jgi:hypothetical protein